MDPRRQRALAFLVAGCFFMENLDGTIVVTAAPAIGADLGVDAASVGVAVTAFLLTVAVFIPASGWLSQRFGMRRIFALAIAIFTVASLLCALSPTLPVLVAARALQGIGAALMVPVGHAAVLRMTPKNDLIRTIAILAWPGLVAPIIAPFVGGLLTTYASWHWIFLINVPLGILAFVVALRIVPSTDRMPVPKLDVTGLVLVVIALGSLVYGSTLVSESGIQVLGFAVATAIGLAVLAVAVRHLLRVSHPLVQLRAFRYESFRIAGSSGAVYRAAVSAIPFLLPLLFQNAFGWTAVDAGAVLLWLFVGNLAIKPATTGLLRRFGFRRVLVTANVVGMACMIAMAFLTADVSLAVLIPLLVLSGAARSTGFTVYATIAYADIGPSSMTDATALNSTLQQLAAGFGVAVGGMALAVGFAVGSGLVPYQVAFAFVAVLTLVPLVAAIRLSPDAGRALTAR
ncbi:MFS transporter [Herbiconiux daphne]|uniref:MFS transporter n=1 Tax=Herbiconiux daphne TaxID=2970914 RepID=A0ABT2H1J1_9MICO|nr:MFS transporter [Herbiconiux daphne]MCS5733814.1 MFS transporter [Herbiconiux daphne]